MDADWIKRQNRAAWDREAAGGSPWSTPVGDEVLDAARRGAWSVVLTYAKPVPREWFANPAAPDPSAGLAGTRLLCLASGGGQQAPVLAAAGAEVTSFDASAEQLARDAERSLAHDLGIRTVQGYMDDLGAFDDASFDLCFHPVSNTFAPELEPVWRELRRVLRPGGVLLAGFMNPDLFLFDAAGEEAATSPSEFRVAHRLPYSDASGRSRAELEAHLAAEGPIQHSHSLVDQLGGQLRAGLVLTDLYEDTEPGRLLGEFLPLCFSSRAVRGPA
ncbi:MAG: class I SAM-dependent methyltransferase [Planctomycetota bacterium]|nr:class I SAM-dependent methyltransferase [Planctomycetota bacterium]